MIEDQGDAETVSSLGYLSTHDFLSERSRGGGTTTGSRTPRLDAYAEDEEEGDDVPEYREPGASLDEEDDDEYYDMDRDEVLDIETFYIPHPLSEEGLIVIPLWTASVEGIKHARIRALDQQYLDRLPDPLKEAMLELKEMLDPLDMNERLPALSPGWLRLFENLFLKVLNATIFRLIHYVKWEFRRLHNDLERLRARDIPGYERTIMDDATDEDFEPLHEQFIPKVLPSTKNLRALILFNKFAHLYEWHVMLVRIERRAPGSRVIGFHLQFSRISHQEPRENTLVSPSAGSFTEFLASEAESESQNSGPPEDVTHKKKNVYNLGGIVNILSQFRNHHSGSLPLLMYSIEKQPDQYLTAEEIISFASVLGFSTLAKSD